MPAKLSAAVRYAARVDALELQRSDATRRGRRKGRPARRIEQGQGGSSPKTEPASRDLGQRVQELVGAMLAHGGGAPDIRRVADTIGTSVRTLQRRLQATGSTYGAAVEQARSAAACRLVKDRRRKIGDVARALGYSDHAHFTRAFQRWTGLTPRDFRLRGRES
jgi:AraC-like DNA-binding protein